MTVIRPNSISGVTSITAQVSDINIFSASSGFANITAGNISAAGTITYEDVTNIDSVGVVTARTGIKIGPSAGVAGTFFADGSYVTAGVITATTFHGSGANLTGISAGTSLSGSTNNTVCTVTGANAIQGESNLTFNGGATGDAQLTVHAAEANANSDSELILETSNDFATSVIMFKDSTAEAGSIAYNHGDNYIKLSTFGTDGGTERMRISKEGYVTKPNTPAFFATHTGNSASDSIGYITYNTGGPYYNNGSHFNVNGRFTAPITGIYHMHFHCFVHTGVTQGNIEIVLRRFNSGGSGETFLTRNFDNKVNSNYGPAFSMAWTGPLTASQYVQVYSYDELHHANGYFFGGYLVG